ncbi:MAG: tetratricopeptide repeat protein [Acidobacteria bacterium]|nr:tetratricopeptide repeat protein [Acidobacteriota bacterium]
MKKKPLSDHGDSAKMRRFQAEADYGESVFLSTIGDQAGSIKAVKRSLEWDPGYAPAIMTMGSVEYQLRRRAAGRKLFLSLLALPESTPHLIGIIDQAGDFLIDRGAYQDGLELFRGAAKKFPAATVFLQGVSCCASHQGCLDEAVSASERALQLEPENQKLVTDLGWSLFLAGRQDEALTVLERAVAMNPAEKLARENLRLCKAGLAEFRRLIESERTTPPARQPRGRLKNKI